MADAKRVSVAADVVAPTKAEASEPEFEYVTIPSKDMFDYPHPGVSINRDNFEAGKTYRLPKDLAAEVKDRLAIFEAQNIRILQPRKDMRALADLAKERGSQYVDMTRDNTKSV